MKCTFRSTICTLTLAAVSCGAPKAHATFVSDVQGTSGLKAYWRLGETSGTTAVNQVTGIGSQSGTYNNGVILNQTGALTASGDNDPSAYFDGANDWVDMGLTTSGSPLDVAGWTGITMMAWIKPDSLSGSHVVVSRWASSATADQYLLMTTGNKVLVAVGNGVGQSGMTSTGTLTAGQWSFVVGTFDVTSNAYKIYINGSADSASGGQTGTAGITSVLNSSPNAAIGVQELSPGGRWFEGNIDEVAIFNRALTASEVTSLYNAAIAVPEPGTFAMLLFGGIALWAVRRKRTA
jgi:hypothetical protein